jgi:hypothetical protein
MKDILIVGLVGLLSEIMISDGGELITTVLFVLLVTVAIARVQRALDIVVICGIGLLWEVLFAENRNWITLVLFGLPLLRLLMNKLSAQRSVTTGATQHIPWNPLPSRNLGKSLLDGFVDLGKRIKTKNFVFEFIALLGMISLGIITYAHLTRSLGVSRAIIGYGALSYALGAVGFKGLLYTGVVVPVLHKHLSPLWLASSQGFISALSELGAAALFFWLVIPEPLSLPELIAFGAAAGIIEALVIPLMVISGIDILGGTPVGENVFEEGQNFGAAPFAMMIFPILERGLTMALHISSRAVIYAAIALGNVVLALLAVSLFALVDGTAYYALLKKWKVLSLTVAIRFYALVTLCAGILALVFWWVYARL